jgi:hypothetical protein
MARCVPTAGARDARRPHLRWLCIVAVLLSGAVLAYPAAANLFIALGGVQKALEGTDDVKVDFGRAWSFWPGWVHVEDVRIVGQDRNVEFVLTVARADVRIRLRELVHRTLHVTRVRGSGVAFRFRHRITPDYADAPTVAALPPIGELDDPPIRLAGPPPPPLDEAHYNLWTVHIDDVDVGMRELWTQMFRFQGEGRARGAFRLRPAKRLWVGPAELTIRSGDLTTGSHGVLHGVEGMLTCTVDDFDVQPVHGMEPLRFVSARLRLSAQVPSLEAINYLTAPSSTFRLADGSGALDADVAIDHGVFTPDSHLSYRTDHVGIETESIQGHLDGTLSLLANRLASGGAGQIELDVPDAAVKLDRSSHLPLQLHNAAVSLATTSIDVTRDWSFAGGHGTIDQATLADLGWLNDLPSTGQRSWNVAGGRGWASGSITFSPNADLVGDVAVRAEQANGTVGMARWRGSADAAVTLRSAALRHGNVRGHVALGPFRVWNDAGASSETSYAELGGDVSFTERHGMNGQLHAKTASVKADIGDKQLVVSSLGGDVRFTADGAQGTVEVRDLRGSANGVSSTTPLARLEGRFWFPAHRQASGRLRLGTGDWTADFGGSHLVGSSLRANVELVPARIVADLLVQDVRASALGSCPWVEIKTASAAGHLDTPGNGPTTGQLQAALDGTSVRWGELTAAANRLALSGAWDGASLLARFDLSKLHLKNGVGAPRSWQADVGTTSVDTTLAIADGSAAGPVHVDVKQVTGQFGKARLGGDLVADIALVSNDASHRTADISGLVHARHVALSGGRQETDDWWADLTLHRAHLDVREDVDASVKMRAQFRDGLPALRALVSEDQIPSWLPTVFPLDGLTLDLYVERHCGWTDVQVLDATGGTLSARGRLQTEPGETRGAILFRLLSLPFVSLGFDFVEDYSRAKGFVGASWLERQLSPLTTAATEKHDTLCQAQPPTCR